MKTLSLIALVPALALLGACASDPKQENDPAFGSSVRHMINSQIHAPEVAARPAADGPQGMDGARAEKVLKVYREGVDKPASAQKPVTIQVVD